MDRIGDPCIVASPFAHSVWWLATLTAVPQGLGSNVGEGMDVCKCIVPLLHGGTLNSRQVVSPLVRLADMEERWEAVDEP
ncbi:hypothetical protein TNCV_577711 [Trichonephila clavipes]|nr:hypothetical protein TNCV_577711 [Trichonephila clavipes]